MTSACLVLVAGILLAHAILNYLSYSEVVASLGAAEARTDRLKDEREALRLQIKGLEQNIVEVHEAQSGILGRLSERTRVAIDAIERTVRMAGLDVDVLIGRVPEPGVGQGGPYVPAALHGAADVARVGPAELLDRQIDRWEVLHQVARALPLAAPLTQFSVSSGFGPRRDPLNGRAALHQGLDLGAPMRSSVYSTAPGQVVFAGRNGRYGRMVEIDHGFGIRTRYGHLDSILVKRGQVVAHHEKIGLLGNSGRSTGPHVHYEVRVNGKPHDPMNFLEAGRYVFKD
jgi:murein DD-endopeptidase MepM/ murein hydrolase activator NlpD